MNCFYLHDGRHKHGPYQTEELQQFNITKETSVYIAESKRWINAGEIMELAILFQKEAIYSESPLKRIQFFWTKLIRKQSPL